MSASVYIDGFFEACPRGQATARRTNVGPFVFVPNPADSQSVVVEPSSWCSGRPTTALAPCRWLANHSATSVDKANFPRLCSIENTGTGTLFRTTAWRKAPPVGYPNAAVNALPDNIGPWTANKSRPNARASSDIAVVASGLAELCEGITRW